MNKIKIDHKICNIVFLVNSTKDNYSCIGARKWEVGLGIDQVGFRNNILQIYPKLKNVSGYSIWFINRRKQFVQLSIQVSFLCSSIAGLVYTL